MGTTARKERRTYSLDPELVRYVEKVRKERRTDSASAALEEILWESKRQRERKHQDEQIAKYYSSFSDAEIAEDSEWGRFAETQFPIK
ncbi:MAG TPA: hypothetical protein VEV41_18540 [Terriglobales bacterium]|nr:hypothetical protein [Terriglobales bacterium]